MAHELCSPKLIDAVVAEVFDDQLIEAGFQKMRDRFYVRSRIHEMNDVIEFLRDRLNLNFVWGLSFNFVPQITSGVENVRWHRTPKHIPSLAADRILRIGVTSAPPQPDPLPGFFVP